MTITWLGYSCFRIQTEDAQLAIDPYDNSIGLRSPHFTADCLLLTHDHKAHANKAAVSGDPFVIDGPGEYEVKGVMIYGIPSWHDNKGGEERGANTMYLLQAEGISVAHLGDIGNMLDNGQLEKLEGVDVLMIPIGGKHTLDAEAASELISKIEPRIVIPMHYKIPGLTVDLDPITKFAKELGVQETAPVDKLKLAKKDLPQDDMQIVIMKP